MDSASKDPKQPLDVVAALIIQHGKVLGAKRVVSSGTIQPHWEFPGGKIHPGETPETALAREIEEELDCTIRVGQLLTDNDYSYPSLDLRLRCYLSKLVEGEPKPLEHEELRWFGRDSISTVLWAAADEFAIQALKAGNFVRPDSLQRSDRPDLV